MAIWRLPAGDFAPKIDASENRPAPDAVLTIMPIDRAQVEHIAALARIALTDAETAAFTRQLSDILEQFDALQGLDTDGVAPTAHIGGLDNVLRDDEPSASLDAADTLRNAPRRRGDFFQVRAVLDE